MLHTAKYFCQKFISRVFLVGFVSLLATSQIVSAEDVTALEKANFERWLQAVRIEALEKGISEKTIALALSDVKLLKQAIKKDNNQPEVQQTFDTYLNSRISEWRITNGRKMIAENTELFADISKIYKVPPQFVAAIWGLETNYGTFALTIPIFDALATLAYDPRRSAQFRSELFAALKIVDNGDATVDIMMGSWAGAMGQPQFMPQTYIAYAIDHDGDGIRDIWANKGDVFASISSYLKHYGWNADQSWGHEVTFSAESKTSASVDDLEGVSPDAACKSYASLRPWLPLSHWQKKGIHNISGEPLPKDDILAALILSDAGDDKGYLVYRNFCSIMKYNPSFKYALSVSILADKIKGASR